MAFNLFNSFQISKPKKNVFDLTHDVKMSFNMGELVPCLAMECLPGDKFNIGADSLLRFAPMVSPVMHRYDMTIHYFFVPNRIIWPNWEKFITMDNNGAELPAFPTLTLGQQQVLQGTLANYLGLPPLDTDTTMTVSALPFAAYQKIFNDYYRDQNLQTDFAQQIELNDGEQTGDFRIALLQELHKRAWEHDYFTAALPFAQKGDPVSIPLIAPQSDIYVKAKGVTFAEMDATTEPLGIGQVNVAVMDTTPPSPGEEGALFIDGNDIQSQATTITDLRRAEKLQQFNEKKARAGSRYFEQLLAFFGVKSPDSRLQRPEYIGGTKSPVQISEVLNTTGTEDLEQGNMSGHALTVNAGGSSSYYCQEHGYIIGIVSVRPKPAYFQGIPKHFTKFDPYEYGWPEFAHIGEQEVLNKELYVTGSPTDEDVFGYVPRYAEYKFLASRVAGDFQTTLETWQHARKFSATPTLSPDFIQCNPDKRIFAVEDPEVQSLYCHVLNKIRAVRAMPRFGNPGI
uniref:Capsid protein n=1 Tax=Cressdnaviricota sp. TaxID=2748378 RepID=A0A6M3YP37_9VIRU|nr:MAG: capsid protein [Cressdnaviricota sp.]